MALDSKDMNIFQAASRGLLPLAAAEEAHAIYAANCGGKALGGRPGGAVLPYLAFRMMRGKSAAEAAAAEYMYRWHLALQSRVFGVPHTLGM